MRVGVGVGLAGAPVCRQLTTRTWDKTVKIVNGMTNFFIWASPDCSDSQPSSKSNVLTTSLVNPHAGD